MTVAELIDILSAFDDDAEVMVSHIGSDYHRSQIASAAESASPQLVKYSAYHEAWVVPEEMGDAEPEDEIKEAVVIE